MTPAQLDRARRLVQSPRWRWVAGMVAFDSTRLVKRIHVQLGPLEAQWDLDDRVPDLSDYATAAILLRMAMEAGRNGPGTWGSAETPSDDDGGWILSRDSMKGERIGHENEDLGTVAAEALLAAWQG